MSRTSRSASTGPRRTVAQFLHAEFENYAVTSPDAVATEYHGVPLTYRELDSWANRVAHRLGVLGVGAGDRVAIMLDRSPDAVAAILGVLKAGAAYVPLEPEWPRAWLVTVLADTGAAAVVAGREHTIGHETVLHVDADSLAGASSARPEPVGDPAALAYVIYTSGSTGRPKGVAVPHSAAAGYVSAAREIIGLTADDRVLQFASLAFDASVEELFTTLGSGAALIPRTPDMLDSMPRFLARCREFAVSTLDLPTAFLAELLSTCRMDGLRLPQSVRRVIVGGDRLEPEVLRDWHEVADPDVRLWNSYGPTETAVCVTLGRVDAEPATAPVTIGHDVPGAELRILDPDRQPCPDGVIGELYVGGTALADGYLGQPEATALAFVPNHLSDVQGTRLYRTGDLVRRRPDGALEFHGRVDDQLKIRGFRVEPGQVEAAIRAFPDVREALVGTAGAAAATRLVAWVAAADELTAEAVRDELSRKLPAYLVPTTILVLPSLPKNTAGKIDRAALRAIMESGSGTATGDGLAGRIAQVWSGILGVGVGAHDEFLALGGHSLLAMRAVSRMRHELGIDVSVRALFDRATPATLSASVGMNQAGHTARPLTSSAARTPPPLSFGQQRLVEIDRRQPGGSFFNCVSPLRIGGKLNVDALRAALDALIQRHEILRTSYHDADGETTVRVNQRVRVPWVVRQLTGIDANEAALAVMDAVRAAAIRPFPLDTPSMVRAELLTLDETEHVLILTFHHIVIDDWSDAVLTRDVAELYVSIAEGRAPALPELMIQHGDFARWQRETLSGRSLSDRLAWWRERLDGARFDSDPPADVAMPAEPTFAAGIVRHTLDHELTERIDTLCLRHDLTPYMALLAGFVVVLHAESGRTDVCVESPMANRTRWETEDLVGYLVNPVLLRTLVDRGRTVPALLAAVKETCLGAMEHQDVPFGLVVDDVAGVRDLYRNPLPKFIYESGPGTVLRLPGLRVEQLQVDTPPQLKNRYQLTVRRLSQADKIDIELLFNTDYISHEHASRTVRGFERTMSALTGAWHGRVAALICNADLELLNRRVAHD